MKVSYQLQLLYPWGKNHCHPLNEPQKGLDNLAKRNIAVNAGDIIMFDELKENHGVNIHRATTCCHHFFS
jgi:hypothetical protein